MKVFLALWLAISAVAAPPLFFAQNVASTALVLWTPADAGLTAYWLADDISGADLDPVGTWPDGVGSNDATASGSARPTLDLAVAGINGKAAVVFDGVNDGLTYPATGFQTGAAEHYVVVVIKTSETTSWAPIICWGATASNQARFIFAASTSNSIYTGYYINDKSDWGAVGSAWAIVEWKCLGTSEEVWLNGTSLGSRSLSSVNTGSPETGFPRIGDYNDGGFVQYLNGSIAFIGNSTNSADSERLVGWAAHYYGLTANLPGGHPYKTDPPYK